MRKEKVIRGLPRKDGLGDYFGFCGFIRHPGIVRYSQMYQCEHRDHGKPCRYYQKYRPVT